MRPQTGAKLRLWGIFQMTWTFDSPAEKAIFKELQGSSERASAILAHTLIDRRLKQHILSHIRNDTSLSKALFDSNHALGPFEPRCQLGCLLGLYSKNPTTT